MEHGFRITFWMVFLVGYLQAKSVKQTFNLRDLDTKTLADEVKCLEQKATFTFPTNVRELCYAEALKNFTEGLEQAQKICTDDDGFINDTVETLKRNTDNKHFDSKAKNSSQCNWDNKESQEFKEFVKELESLVHRINSISGR